MTDVLSDYQKRNFVIGKYVCLKNWAEKENKLYVEFLDPILEKHFINYILTDKMNEVTSNIISCYSDVSTSNTYYSGTKDVNYYFQAKKEFMFLEELTSYLSSHSLFGPLVEEVRNELIVKEIVQ